MLLKPDTPLDTIIAQAPSQPPIGWNKSYRPFVYRTDREFLTELVLGLEDQEISTRVTNLIVHLKAYKRMKWTSVPLYRVALHTGFTIEKLKQFGRKNPKWMRQYRVPVTLCKRNGDYCFDLGKIMTGDEAREVLLVLPLMQGNRSKLCSYLKILAHYRYPEDAAKMKRKEYKHTHIFPIIEHLIRYRQLKVNDGKKLRWHVAWCGGEYDYYIPRLLKRLIELVDKDEVFEMIQDMD